MCFDGKETLFVGDSQGTINVWRVAPSGPHINVVDHFCIRHKEIEGDQINEIICSPNPDALKQIYVQSRDNCIRLIEFDTSRGTQIRKRFFGAKCSN